MKDGKLFGKINIIDLLIILVIVAALIFVGTRYLNTKNAAPQINQDFTGKTGTVRMTFFAYDAPIVLKDQMEEQLGRPVIDWDNKKNSLGKFCSYEAEDYYNYSWDATSGEIVEIPMPSAFHLTMTSEVAGIISEQGLLVNSVQYSIGGSYTICVGQTRIYVRLADFEYVNE